MAEAEAEVLLFENADADVSAEVDFNAEADAEADIRYITSVYCVQTNTG